MPNMIYPFSLTDFPKVDPQMHRTEIIEATKSLNKILKDSRNSAKQQECYYCKESCDSFCNSHTVPAFCLRNIAQNGKVYYMNSIIELPLLKGEKGVNEAGTFHLICRKCDGEIFQDYENPDNYEEIPTMKMLAEIHMKNSLKNISKRLIEIEMYGIMQDRLNITGEWTQAKTEVSDLDLNEYKEEFAYAKKRSLKPISGDYYIGYYEKLPYVVPVAFQGTIAMQLDMEGNIINDVYNMDPTYKIRNMSLYIFPLENTSIVMIFVSKNNNRYGRFFKQLKKLHTVEAQLSAINYILFSYTEDYFISPSVEKSILDELAALSAKSSDLLAMGYYPSQEMLHETVKNIYGFQEMDRVPNLLAEEYAVG